MVDFRLAYLVCATPRSGSTLLCEMLTATGCAGRPLEHFEVLRHSGLPRQPREYFDGEHPSETLARLAPTVSGTPSRESPEAWRERIREAGLTDNGVWGGKIMWGHVDDFLARARELPGLDPAGLHEAVQGVLGPARFVFNTRPDHVAQAVSLWRAVQTRAWRAGTAGAVAADEPAYDFAGIDHLVTMLADHERAWSDWFARSGIDPVRVTYDDLDADPQATVAEVLEALGIEGAALPDPHLGRQRDERSLAWADRYRREREAAA